MKGLTMSASMFYLAKLRKLRRAKDSIRLQQKNVLLNRFFTHA